jgi:hypothetical protein
MGDRHVPRRAIGADRAVAILATEPNLAAELALELHDPREARDSQNAS